MPRLVPPLPDPILRIIIVAVVFGVAVTLVYRKVPPSLKDKHFQIASAIEREVSKGIQYAGATACGTCHVEQQGIKKAGYHRDISCETCHGPGQDHVENPVDLKPPAPRHRQFCPTCHAYDPSRPMGFPQINPVTHHPIEPCITCHNPHDPKPPTVPDECAGCHGEIDRTKAVSPHALLDCTTCHVTPEEHKVTPRSIRPSKPTDPVFCSTCHGMDSGIVGTPKVDLETHGVKYVCWQCHYPHMPEVHQ